MRRLPLFVLILGWILLFNGCSSQPVSSQPSYPLNSALQESLKSDELDKLYRSYQADPENKVLLLELTQAYQDAGDNKSCVSIYKAYLERKPKDTEILVNLAYAQMNQGDYDEALVTCEATIEIDPAYISAYNALGNVYGDLTEYNKAIEQYQRALSLNKDYTPAKTNILWALYNGKQYEKCIDEANKFLGQGFEAYDVYYYLGGSYEAVHKLTEAKGAFKKALEFEYSDHSTTYYHLGWLAYQQELYIDAEADIKSALKINPQNQDALALSEYLEELNYPAGFRLGRFMDKNYLYKDYQNGFDEAIRNLKSKEEYSEEALLNIAKEAIHPNDPFSFFITGPDYKLYMEEQEGPSLSHSTRILDGKSYELVKLDTFNKLTGQEFITLADSLEDKEHKVLVFDIRGNTGGDMKACSEILDYLLGECAVVNFVDRKGYVSSYYSSADKVTFKKVIVLSDNQTASAGELLALSLKVYLPDTLIIGQTTYGKGVSQLVFDDPQHQLALFLVNTYWNVREINIDGYGISPDEKAVTENEFEQALKNALSVVQ